MYLYVFSIVFSPKLLYLLKYLFTENSRLLQITFKKKNILISWTDLHMIDNDND